MVTIFSQPGCQPCRLAKMALDKAGLSYEDVDVTINDDAAQQVRDWGYSAVPVVSREVSGEVEHHAGFKPDLIAAWGRNA